MTYFFSHFSGLDIGVSPIGNILINVVLVMLLVTCMITDAREHKIYNKYTFPAMAIGLLLNGVFGGWQGLLWAFIGWAVGMAIQWIPFMLGFAKAGDVKLLAAVGALKGWFFCSFGFLFGAIAFGMLMLPWLLKNNELKTVTTNLKTYLGLAVITQKNPEMPQASTQKRYMPWAVGLGIGFLIALALELTLGQAFWIQF